MWSPPSFACLYEGAYTTARPTGETRFQNAHDQPADSQRPRQEEGEDQDACALGRAAAARRLHARLDDHPQEAELGAAQDRARPADERDRGRHLHSGRGAQPAGAFGRARPRRPHERPSGLPLQGDPRGARHRRRRRPQAGPLQVRRQEGQQANAPSRRDHAASGHARPGLREPARHAADEPRDAATARSRSPRRSSTARSRRSARRRAARRSRCWSRP